MMGGSRHQLDHTQIICTLLQTNFHSSTSSLKLFCRTNALPNAQLDKALKALKA